MKRGGFFQSPSERRLQEASRKDSPQESFDSAPKVFTDVTSDPFVRGLLHRPENPNGNGLILAHGAGSNCQAPLLVALANTFSAAGYLVLRCDLPFRQDRPYGPPGPRDAKRDRAGLNNAVDALRPMIAGRLFLGGHSYGGRQASMLCAESAAAPSLAAGLLLLSYPLHPPRKPEQLRTQHFFELRTPALFVQGVRDPFASIEEMQRAIKLIPSRTSLVPIDGEGHDLGFKGRSRSEGLSKVVLTEFESFFGIES